MPRTKPPQDPALVAREKMLQRCRELTQSASAIRQHTSAILGVELRREVMGDAWADELLAYHKARLKGYGVEL